ncbi:response regulator [Rhodanobacter glycinis]|uniref:Two-component system, OmpR family, response regulator n=1 Tax=Rhodanobacter glycinis TaxID=582702 RepID=A0A1I4ARZ6_9GAMM|nr:response regulator [Rhodanobacter glycinis]SFK58661.1 two-component system, OmpR family, response regulator [Rhodanobacter glycinis]
MKFSTPSTRQPHVLIVDDDQQIRAMLARFLNDHGLCVTTAGNGVQMRDALGRMPVDLIVLDVMLPGESGLSLCRQLQDAERPVPVILLTAMDGEADRVVGLELGADDYIVKPFNPSELIARIRAVLRRTYVKPDQAQGKRPVYRFAGWMLNVSHRSLTSPTGMLTDLTSGEFDLLLAFVEHPQEILSRDRLLDLARGRNSNPFDRSIDVQISRLRRKIEARPLDPVLIKTVRNGGYFFAADVCAEDHRQTA